MNNKKQVAIVLGGTNPHVALINNLKKRDYYTILIDYLENPPAARVADEHIRESTLDKEIVLSVAKNKNANLVISTCIDQANVIACYVSERLGLSTPYSYRIALDISNKSIMKKKMLEGSIPTSSFIHVEENALYKLNSLKFPLVVKPSDSNGSKGVRIVNNQLELDKYLLNAFTFSRNKQAVIEEYVVGEEIGVDCFISDNKAHIISTHRKRKPKTNDGSVIFSIGSISPVVISDVVMEKINETANQIAKVFQLNNTPLLIQVIVNESDVKVIEFAPRIGGGLNFRKIKLFTGFDIIDAAIDSFLGIKVFPEFVYPCFYYSENHIYTEPGVFGEVVGYKELIEKNIIVDLYPNKTRGMKIQPGKASKDRSASFIVKADTVDEITNKVRKALHTIKVLDVNGVELSFLENYKNLLF